MRQYWDIFAAVILVIATIIFIAIPDHYDVCFDNQMLGRNCVGGSIK